MRVGRENQYFICFSMRVAKMWRNSTVIVPMLMHAYKHSSCVSRHFQRCGALLLYCALATTVVAVATLQRMQLQPVSICKTYRQCFLS